MSFFDSWMADLQRRYLAELRFAEVSRALRALSSTYVERRNRIREGAALAGAGKRAAFALFYAPLHFLTVREVVNGISSGLHGRTLVDLGCGTGAAGAAWAEAGAPDGVVAVDRNAWALEEASRTYRHFRTRVRTRQGDLTAMTWPATPAALLAAFSVNELDDTARDRLLPRLIERGRRGDVILIVEPLARAVAPWWHRWREAFEGAGGRANEWRVRAELPEIVRKLDRAAGLDHRELTARSLVIGSRSG
jgi:hypothetical protein